MWNQAQRLVDHMDENRIAQDFGRSCGSLAAFAESMSCPPLDLRMRVLKVRPNAVCEFLRFGDSKQCFRAPQELGNGQNVLKARVCSFRHSLCLRTVIIIIGEQYRDCSLVSRYS